MSFYQLAFRYLLRKKAKSILLFCIFVLIGGMILSTFMMLKATKNSKRLIQEKTNAKVILEVKDEKDRITESDLEKVRKAEDVTFINRQSHNFIFPASCMPVTASDSEESDNLKVIVFTYDDLENDSPFFEQQYRLTCGTYIAPETENSAVINSVFAGQNEIALGDILEFRTDEEMIVSVKVIGLFLSGNERKQSADTLSINRIENQIFVDNSTYRQMFGNAGYHKACVYTKNPGKLEALESELAGIFSDAVSLKTSDALFQQTKAPLEQIAKIIKIVLVLTFITGTAVVSLLLCMWMRTRKKEAAIFISIGKSKWSILAQVLLESFCLFGLSVAGACVIGNFIAALLEEILAKAHTADIAFAVTLELQSVISLLGIGSLIVLIGVVISMFPILKSNPKDTLSRMEG